MRVATGQDGAPLRLAFGLDGLVLAALVAYVIVTGGHGRQDGGFFADPVPDGLAVLALAAAIGAGAIAAGALVREPPRTRAGRWAVGMAIAFTLSFPVLGLITAALGLEQGWAEPVVPLQMAAALGAMLLGAVAREPDRRGLLLIPLVIGASALMLFLVDLLLAY
jgi:hypothetical protein